MDVITGVQCTEKDFLNWKQIFDLQNKSTRFLDEITLNFVRIY